MPSWVLLLAFYRLSVPSGADARYTLRQGGEGAWWRYTAWRKNYIGLLDLSTHAEIAVIWNDGRPEGMPAANAVGFVTACSF